LSAVLKMVQKPQVRTVSVSTETYVNVDVEVPLSEISTDDLIEELSTRDGQWNISLLAIYEAMAIGNKERALELMLADHRRLTPNG
jgi:hypothetical protein